MDALRIISPTGGLGYGFPEESLEEGIKRNPHLIGVDAGSIDASASAHTLYEKDNLLEVEDSVRLFPITLEDV